MRRGRIFIYLALIIILGLAAAYIVFTRVITPADESASVDGEPVPTPTPEIVVTEVIVLTQPIARGGIIQEDMLTRIPYPEEGFLPSMFQDEALVVDRQAKYDLEAGVVLTAGMLVESADQLSPTGSVAALSIPDGWVAVSIPITRLSSVSYAPRPGDHVMVIMTMMFVDLDSEFQSRLPNLVSGVIAPGPAAVLGANTYSEQLMERLELTDIGEYSKQDFIAFPAEGGPSVVAVTSQVLAAGTLSFRGRTEIDPILNELFYLVPSEEQRARLVSQTFLPDVMVLHVGNFSTEAEELARKEAELAAAAPAQETAPADAQQAAPVEEQVILPPDIITIVVRPQDAVTLNYLLYSGAELTLALRAAGDSSVESTEAATLQFLLDEYNIPIPAKLPFGIDPGIFKLEPPVLLNDQPEVIAP
ncbi:MAG: hypothetical protein JW862_04830 [Anaerolineales bacterium]|nr:hypothetical protein [Anaerolineales bacterium]